MHSCFHMFMPSYILSFIYSYIHAFIHSCITQEQDTSTHLPTWQMSKDQAGVLFWFFCARGNARFNFQVFDSNKFNNVQVIRIISGLFPDGVSFPGRLAASVQVHWLVALQFLSKWEVHLVTSSWTFFFLSNVNTYVQWLDCRFNRCMNLTKIDHMFTVTTKTSTWINAAAEERLCTGLFLFKDEAAENN